VCEENNIEPIMVNDQVMLICPKTPDEDVREKILSLIPEDQPSTFIESIRTNTKVNIEYILGVYQPRSVRFRIPKKNHILLDVEGQEQTCFVSGNPLWGMIASCLNTDPFVKSYMIRFNGKIVLDSENLGAVEEAINDAVKVVQDAENDFEHDPADINPMPVVESNKPAMTRRKVAAPVIKDDRFNYDKEFLPPDVGTDMKILLEATKDSGEFLRSLGVNV
jgi:hypothetical protein